MKTGQKQNLKMKFWIIWCAVANIFRKTYPANECKHGTKREGTTVSFGERYVIGMPLAENGRPNHCLECIGKMAILCARCGRPIHIGDNIALYCKQPDMKCLTDKEWMKHVHSYQSQAGGPVYMVCCDRRNCIDTAGDYRGIWLPPGRVERRPSLFEQFDLEMAKMTEDGDCGVLLVKV